MVRSVREEKIVRPISRAFCAFEPGLSPTSIKSVDLVGDESKIAPYHSRISTICGRGSPSEPVREK